MAVLIAPHKKKKQMTMTGYWQHTMLLQCSLQVVRYEFLHLCLDLVRSYAPFERRIYYEEDPAIGEHFYLAAVKQQRREREEAQRKRRRTEGRAEHQVLSIARACHVSRVTCHGTTYIAPFFFVLGSRGTTGAFSSSQDSICFFGRFYFSFCQREAFYLCTCLWCIECS